MRAVQEERSEQERWWRRPFGVFLLFLFGLVVFGFLLAVWCFGPGEDGRVYIEAERVGEVGNKSTRRWATLLDWNGRYQVEYMLWPSAIVYLHQSNSTKFPRVHPFLCMCLVTNQTWTMQHCYLLVFFCSHISWWITVVFIKILHHDHNFTRSPHLGLGSRYCIDLLIKNVLTKSNRFFLGIHYTWDNFCWATCWMTSSESQLLYICMQRLHGQSIS